VAAEAPSLPPALHPDQLPTSSSWLNLAERWFAELTNRKLRRSAHRSVTELENDIRKWINEWNKHPKPFTWAKSADDILETVAEYCQAAGFPLDRIAALVAGMVQGAPAAAAAGPDQLGRRRLRPAPLHP
jgi:hypothetical protein